MFARLVSTHLKPGSFEAATRKFEKEIIPTLKMQKGFRDEVSFFDRDKNEALAISFWDSRESAEIYANDVFPKVVSDLKDINAGKPEVKMFEVGNSTWHGIHA